MIPNANTQNYWIMVGNFQWADRIYKNIAILSRK